MTCAKVRKNWPSPSRSTSPSVSPPCARLRTLSACEEIKSPAHEWRSQQTAAFRKPRPSVILRTGAALLSLARKGRYADFPHYAAEDVRRPSRPISGWRRGAGRCPVDDQHGYGGHRRDRGAVQGTG